MQFSSFNDVVSFALEKEAGAQVFYASAAKKATRPETRRMFAELAEEEERHRRQLEDLKQEDLTGLSPSTYADTALAEALPDIVFSPDMTFREALTLAIKAEERARSLYLDLVKKVPDLPLRFLFRFLADQEALHGARLQTEYEQHVLMWD
jgi:rubrerythrin